MDLAGLIERVEKATGPDRELDAAVCVTLNYVAAVDDAEPQNLRVAEDDPEWLDYELVNADGSDDPCTDGVTPLTASIDGAHALVERKLPGVWWFLAKGRTRPDEPLFGVHLIRKGTQPDSDSDSVLAEAEHDDLCCAIILALLRALQKEAT